MINFGELEADVGCIMHMDRVHVHWMLAAFRALKPTRVIEIGCYKGVSTTAIIQAYDEGAVQEVHLVDINIQPTVRNMARPNVHFHEMASTQALPQIACHTGDTIVIIDGDHTWNCVRHELPLALAKNPVAIIAHDVTAEAAGYGACDGAHRLWQELQRQQWRCFVDCKRRDNAETHRGLLMACRDLQRAELIAQAWASTCEKSS